ncbi:hypothetical protein KIPB_000854 [Kipferlia bialata]|uniref:Beta'-coat protein n=1 Tax=Kipferlia bialata TaxID=797122 RepID=A0A9K3CPW4_9EUKA|nr:hypothetical protein KIPB_000854 [Kipferlia bialata]|eukprot:g854.t1
MTYCSLVLEESDVVIYDVSTGLVAKQLDVTVYPIRAVRFIPGTDTLAVGSDDGYIRLYDYSTEARVGMWQAHTDYIRALLVLPDQKWLVSCGDDTTIRVWDYQTKACLRIYEGHTRYAMALALSPDGASLASASLDGTVKVWGVAETGPTRQSTKVYAGHYTPNEGVFGPLYTLKGHTADCNAVCYLSSGSTVYVASGSDDRTVKIWDTATRSALRTIPVHTDNVTCLAYHARMGCMVSGSEDGLVGLVSGEGLALDKTCRHKLGRVWCVEADHSSNRIVIGGDTGCVVVQLGLDRPLASLDQRTGRMVFAGTLSAVAGGAEPTITPSQQGLVQGMLVGAGHPSPGSKGTAPTGETGTLHSVRALDQLSVAGVQQVEMSPNGRLCSVVHDNEVVVYSTLSWKQKGYMAGQQTAWRHDPKHQDLAVLEGGSVSILTGASPDTAQQLALDYPAEAVFGGPLLCVRGPDFLDFFTWQGAFVQQINVVAEGVVFSPRTPLLSISTEDTTYIMQSDLGVIASATAKGEDVGEEGVEGALELVAALPYAVSSAAWFHGVLHFIDASTGGLHHVVPEYAQRMHDAEEYVDRHTVRRGVKAEDTLLGFCQDRCVLLAKDGSVTTVSVNGRQMQAYSLIEGGKISEASTLVSSETVSVRDQVAQYMQDRGMLAEALALSPSPALGLSLLSQLHRYSDALALLQTEGLTGSYPTLAKRALDHGAMGVAVQCYIATKDYGSALTILSVTEDTDGLTHLASQAEEEGAYNIAFLCLYQTGDAPGCLRVMEQSGQEAHAAMFARGHKGVEGQTERLLGEWRESLIKSGRERVAESLRMPHIPVCEVEVDEVEAEESVSASPSPTPASLSLSASPDAHSPEGMSEGIAEEASTPPHNPYGNARKDD